MPQAPISPDWSAPPIFDYDASQYLIYRVIRCLFTTAKRDIDDPNRICTIHVNAKLMRGSMAETEDAETTLDDLSDTAANMAQLLETSQEIWKTYLETRKGDEFGDPDPMHVIPSLANFAGVMAMKPQEIIDAATEFWTGQMALWQSATAKAIGNGDPAVDLPDLPSGGRRFSHPQWSENALFEYIKNSYFLTSKWAQSLIETAGDDLELSDRKKMEFLTRTAVDAINPANFYATNPEVLETTVRENGANLVRGAEMFLEDMRRGDGDLLIRQTDMNAFEVGRDMAITPGKVIWQNDILQLIQYAPSTDKVHETPLLFIPPWINKFYVLDLNEKKSLMKWLVGQGHSVFMISWVNPDERHGDKTWEDYIFQGALATIDKVLEETGAKSTHIASYCIGGTLTGTMMAYLSQSNDKRVKSTTFFTAQLDFADAGELQVFVDQHTLEKVDQQMEKGFLPAKAMAKAFNSLRANDLIWSYVVSNYLLGKEPFPFDLLYWNSDSTAMPARVHHFYLEQFYMNNSFAGHALDIADKHVEISDITGPVYHVATVEDHIAPAASVYRGAKLMEKADVTFVLSGSGHIAGVVNPPAAGKYQYWLNTSLDAPDLAAWKDKAEMTDGSWWPNWDAWLSQQSKKKVAGRAPGKTLGTIEDAPGSFVRVRFDAQD